MKLKAISKVVKHTKLRSPNSHLSNPSASRSSLLDDFTNFCYKRDLPRAIETMHLMQTHNLYADPITYTELIKSCLSHNATDQAKVIHTHLFSNPQHPPETFLLNSLLNLYVKFDLLTDAEKLFDEMPARNVVSWTTLISAYSSCKFNDKALKALVLMVREGVGPNMFTFSSVLRACEVMGVVEQIHCRSLKVGFRFDPFVGSALIDVYSKLGDLDSALVVFNEMGTCDMVIWSSIIGGFAQNDEGDEAMNLFKKMKRAGLMVNQSTLTSILRACTGLALLELGRQVHVQVLKYNQDLILNNALLDMYCKCGSLEDANCVFARMLEKDVISWSTMIAGLAQNGYSKEALRLFESMKVSGIKPNCITMVGVLFACSHAGLVEDGWNHFRSMKQCYGIVPEREHYGCVIDLLGRAGRLDEAIALINEMENEPDAVTWRTLLSACRVHCDVELATHAAKQVLRLDPLDAGTYILLSNIYANTQRWDLVREVRTAMTDRGVCKEPGCSWIEVDKKIHAFILGDNYHPQINEINVRLNLLIHKLMEVGYAPDTNFVLQDLEGEQRENTLRYHSEKLALVFGLMSLSQGQTIRIRKNLRICGDCHLFAKLVAKMENRTVVISDPLRYHHFRNGVCSCGDYW